MQASGKDSLHSAKPLWKGSFITFMNEWKTVVPIWSFYRDDSGIFNQPVEIGDGIKIIKSPLWFSNKGIRQYLGHYQENTLD
jgi:hypothetical protein